MARRQYEPRRTCLGCGAQDVRKRMIRLRVGTQGQLFADDSGAGRGGYLHRLEDCWKNFVRRKSVYRAFRVEVGKSFKEKIVQEIRERHGE